MPETGSFTLSETDARALVADAVLAPSIHNTQPWRFVVHDDTIDLVVDPSRRLLAADPDARAQTVSCGAALLALRLAVRVRLGREPVTRLAPDPDDPRLLASVRVAGPSVPTPDEVLLHTQLPVRRTSREPFTGEPVAAATLAAMQEAAQAEGTRLGVTDRSHRRFVLDLTREAERAFERDPAYRVELARWTTGRGEGEGIPASAMGVRPRGVGVPLRDFTVTGADTRPAVPFESDADLAVLLSDGDTVVDRLRSGQALMRLLLTATAHGASVSFLDQAVEKRGLRWLLRNPVDAWGYPQAVLRLGYRRSSTPVPPVPRRAVDDVLTVLTARTSLRTSPPISLPATVPL